MLLQKAKGIHIDGRKAMSKQTPLQIHLNPKFVYIHLLQQASPLKRVVEVGDSVKIGQVVALREGFGAMPIHASVSGKVTAVKKVWHSSGKMVDAIEIENDQLSRLDDSIMPEVAPENLSRPELIDKMIKAGLAGLGGAGFPAYVKYQAKSKIDVVIINAIECEPYITCDYVLISEYPEKLLKGLHYMIKAAGADRGVIAFKSYNKHLAEILTPLLKDYPTISLFASKDLYPAGWEKYIIQQITKKTYNGLPAEAGCVVSNAQTAIVYADVVERNIPLISRVITISGEGIKQPQNFLVPIGTPVKELIAECGGYVEGLDPAKAYYIAGGPMTGRSLLIDELIVNDTLGSVVVKPLPEERLNPACLGCGKCSDVCPVYLAPTEIQRAYESKDLNAVKALNPQKCMACGLCSYVCPSRIEIADFVAKAKDYLRKGA